MWIPFAGIFLGMMGMPEGSYSWVELPSLARISIVATGVLMAVSTVSLIGSPLMSWRSNSSLWRNGRKGEGVILDIKDTGTTVNNSYMVHFDVEVHPMGGPPFVASTEQLINRLYVPQLQPGTRVPVRYDAKNKRVALDLTRAAADHSQPTGY
jgi:hypothetical protein